MQIHHANIFMHMHGCVCVCVCVHDCAHACVYTRPTYSDDIAISVFRRRKVTPKFIHRKVAAVATMKVRQFVTIAEKKLQMKVLQRWVVQAYALGRPNP